MKKILASLITSLVLFSACSSPESFSLANVVFELPGHWQFVERDEHTVTVSVPDPSYNVQFVMEFSKSGEDLSNETLLHDGVSDVYQLACGGAFACYYVSVDGVTHLAMIYITSDQPVPEGIDGVWTPDTTLTREELEEWLGTARSLGV